MILTPIIMIIMAVIVLFASFGGAVADVAQGGTVKYNEEVFQDYADQQYAAEFGASTAYEDNLLLVFLTTEDDKGYAYIAWVGDHVDPQINMLFGAEGTALGTAMTANVNGASYKYSLDSDLSRVVTGMQQQVKNLGLEDSFSCDETHAQVKSHLTNRTDLSMTQETVDTALQSFTESTGIPMVIVVDEAEDVLGKSVNTGSWLTIAIAGLMILIAVVLLVKAFTKRRNSSRDDYRGNDYDRY